VRVRLHRGERSRAFVLVAVIVVILMASMVAVSLLFRLKAENTAAATGANSEQAWAAAMSGVYEAIRIAAAAQAGDLDWQNNPAAFRDQLVVDDGVDRWYFSVYSEGDGEQAIRYGLADEASKLNVNTVTNTMLTRLGLTPYLAEGLADFIDADDTPQPLGAEQEYYDTLASPYLVFNRPLSSPYELFLVRGFTPRVVYGEDANLNGLLDANEDDGDERFPPDNADGKLFAGLRTLLTVCAYDVDDNNNGELRWDLNYGPLGETPLPAAITNYIYAMRSNQVVMHHPAELLEATNKGMASGVGKEELPLVLDLLTGAPLYHLPGLININTASAQVLRALPEVDDALADSIVSTRKGLGPEQRKTPAWLYQQDLVDAPKFKSLAPRLTARSLQFHFHAIGYGIPSGRYRVLEAIIDVAGAEPSVSYLRDITKLGLPFRLPTEQREDDRTTQISGASWRHGRAAPSAVANRGLTSRFDGATKEVPRG
jgi:type II secretory pathway component PulK